jgi:hypothetical protein
MIAADTSTWIAFLQGDNGEDTQLLDRVLDIVSEFPQTIHRYSRNIFSDEDSHPSAADEFNRCHLLLGQTGSVIEARHGPPGVRGGYSVNRSSTVSPFAGIRTIWWTEIRVPFTHACP